MDGENSREGSEKLQEGPGEAPGLSQGALKEGGSLATHGWPGTGLLPVSPRSSHPVATAAPSHKVASHVTDTVQGGMEKTKKRNERTPGKLAGYTKEKLLADLKAMGSMNAVAEKLNVQPGAISYTCKKYGMTAQEAYKAAGVTPPSNAPHSRSTSPYASTAWDPKQIAAMVRKDGVYKTAAAKGVHMSTVYAYLDKHGIDRPSGRGGARSKKKAKAKGTQMAIQTTVWPTQDSPDISPSAEIAPPKPRSQARVGIERCEELAVYISECMQASRLPEERYLSELLQILQSVRDTV